MIISFEIPDEIVEAFEALRDMWVKLKETIQAAFEELHKLVKVRDALEDGTREAWREAALLAGQRAQARALAYDRQMQAEKAQRAISRRKRLRIDGGLPDW